MQILIVEDEIPAANRLIKLINTVTKNAEIVGKTDSIESTVEFLQKNEVDLIFMDIQLADGLSFEIFNQTTVKAPVIFTTAFDQFTLKAFKVNSIDYLLKPVDTDELKQAINKFEKLHSSNQAFSAQNILQLLNNLNKNKYKERILIKRGQQIAAIKTDTIAFAFADGKLCFIVDNSGTKFLVEQTLSQLEEELNPQKFYRISRHLIVQIDAITKVHNWLNGRLKLELNPSTTIDTIVSRERVTGFKEWLGS